MGVTITILLLCLAALLAASLTTYVVLLPATPPRITRIFAHAVSLLLMSAVLGEAIHAGGNIAPGEERSLEEGSIVAQIYREAYSYDLDGTTVEAPEGWYLRIGSEPPAKPETDVAPFATSENNVAFINHTDTPGATMRASIQNLDEHPLQICTGKCAGLSALTNGDILKQSGIVLADWYRVQHSIIGEKAMMPVISAVAPSIVPAPGRWLISIGIGLLLAAGAALLFRSRGVQQTAPRPRHSSLLLEIPSRKS